MSDIDPSKFEVVEYTPDLCFLCSFFNVSWYFDKKQSWSISLPLPSERSLFEGTIYFRTGDCYLKYGLKTVGLSKDESDRVMKVKHSDDFDNKMNSLLEE